MSKYKSKRPYDSKNKSKLARKVASKLYPYITKNQKLFNARPGTIKLTKKEWDTIAWNVSWMAADFIYAYEDKK